MRRILSGLAFFTAVLICFDGCSLVQSTESMPVAQQPELFLAVHDPELASRMEEFLEQPGSQKQPGLDLQQLGPGQHIKVVARENTDADVPASITIYSSSFAGTVKAVEEHCIVLQDVVMITEHRSASGVPIVSKVPYVSRLFRNAGIALAGRRIPGDVTFEKSRIMHAVELSDEEFKNLPITESFERMGVDFDFAAEGEP